jgi:hypothetical protein
LVFLDTFWGGNDDTPLILDLVIGLEDSQLSDEFCGSKSTSVTLKPALE